MTDAVVNMMNTMQASSAGVNPQVGVNALKGISTPNATQPGMPAIEGLIFNALVQDPNLQAIESVDLPEDIVTALTAIQAPMTAINPSKIAPNLLETISASEAAISAPFGQDISNLATVIQDTGLASGTLNNPLFSSQNAASTPMAMELPSLDAVINNNSYETATSPHFLPNAGLNSQADTAMWTADPLSNKMNAMPAWHTGSINYAPLASPAAEATMNVNGKTVLTDPMAIMAAKLAPTAQLPQVQPAAAVPLMGPATVIGSALDSVVPMSIQPALATTGQQPQIIADGSVTDMSKDALSTAKEKIANKMADIKDMMMAKQGSTGQNVLNANGGNALAGAVGMDYGFTAGLNTLQMTAPSMMMQNAAGSETFSQALKAISGQPNSDVSLDNISQQLSKLMASTDTMNGGEQQGRAFTGGGQQQLPWAAQLSQSVSNGAAPITWQDGVSWSSFSDTFANENMGSYHSIAGGLGNMRGESLLGASPALSSNVTLAQQALGHRAANQVGLAISKTTNADVERFTINLKPAELGAVKISMNFASDGKVQAMILAERPETLEMLQKDSRSIERALEEAGHKLDKDSVKYDLDKEGNGKAWANAMQQENHAERMEANGMNGDQNFDETPWPKEEEISLDDILPLVTAETGLDISV